MRDWLSQLPAGKGLGAAFETRIHWSPGGATRAIERGLQTAGYRRVARGHRFFVTGSYGPLRDGELEAARAWGSELAHALAGQQLESSQRPSARTRPAACHAEVGRGERHHRIDERVTSGMSRRVARGHPAPRTRATAPSKGSTCLLRVCRSLHDGDGINYVTYRKRGLDHEQATSAARYRTGTDGHRVLRRRRVHALQDPAGRRCAPGVQRRAERQAHLQRGRTARRCQGRHHRGHGDHGSPDQRLGLLGRQVGAQPE